MQATYPCEDCIFLTEKEYIRNNDDGLWSWCSRLSKSVYKMAFKCKFKKQKND